MAPVKHAREAAPAYAPVKTEPKKLIERTTQSKPKFSPVVIEFDRSGADSGAERKNPPEIVKNK